MKKARLMPSSLVDFLDKLPSEVGDILDGIESKDSGAKKTIPLVVNTLKDLTNELFAYLPEGERGTILASCGTWLDVGMLIGAAPDKLKEILINAKVMELDEEENDGK